MKKSLFAIYTVLFADNFGFAIAFTLFARLLLCPEYGMLGEEISFHTKNLWLALLFGIFPFAQFFGAPLLGDLADHYGRKVSLYITSVGCILGYIISAFAIGWHNLPILLLSRAVTGFFAGNMSISLAAVADLSPSEKERSANYGIAQALTGTGWILSMIVGGISWDPEVAFWISALLTLGSLLCLIWLFEETNVNQTKGKFHLLQGIYDISKAFIEPATRCYYLVYFFWVMGWGMISQWFAAFVMQKFGATYSSAAFWLTISAVMWFFGGVALNYLLLKRWKSYHLCLIGFPIATLLLLIACFIDCYSLFALLFTLANPFSSMTMINILNLVSIYSKKEGQGKALGVSQSVSSFAWMLNALLAAFVSGNNIVLLYPVGVSVMAVGVLLLLKRRLID